MESTWLARHDKNIHNSAKSDLKYIQILENRKQTRNNSHSEATPLEKNGNELMTKTKFQLLASSLLLLLSNSATFAETFDGIQFEWKMSDIRRAYSNAKIEKIEKAKVRRFQNEFRINGVGIEGSIDLLLSDTSITFCVIREKEKYPNKTIDSSFRSCEENGIGYFSEALATIDRITWNPNKPIDATRYYKKYGEPDTAFVNDKMESVSIWLARKVYVVSDEQTNKVIRIEYLPSNYDFFNCSSLDMFSTPNCILWRAQIEARTKGKRNQLLLDSFRGKK